LVPSWGENFSFPTRDNPPTNNFDKIERGFDMNKIWKKAMIIVSIAAMSLTTIDCKKDKSDDTGLLLAALYFLSQTEYTVTLTATLLESPSNLAIRDGKVTLSAGATDILSAGQASLFDYTGCQTAAALTTSNQRTTDGLDGEFVLNFKVTAISGTFNLTTVGSTGANTTTASCDTIAALDPSTFTDSIGTASMALNINESDLTNTNQVAITASGFKINVKSITVVKKGTYNLASPTVGENVCDGKSVIGSPEVLSGDITSAITISNSAILSGTVTVKSGGSLTISPGAAIFGNRGASLFIQDGGSVSAIGTAASPICFTSAQNPGSRYPSDWGGIVVIGNGSATRSSNTEGTTPQSYPRTSNATLNLKYAIVEFAGNEVAPGDELNGISSYAVTTASNYSYVQVHRGLDDSFEWWGGTVAGDHLLSTGGLDDDFDMDEGYSGTLNTLIGVKYPTTCGGSPSTDPHGMEMDGSDTSGAARSFYTNPTVSNFTLIGADISGGYGQRYREGMTGTFSNGLIWNFTSGNILCNNNAGGGANTNPTTTNIYGMSTKSSTIGSQCTSTTINATVTALPVTSIGNITSDSCGFSASKPDFTTLASAPGTGGGASSGGKWWADWTVYRAR
jgi:hypothetical protein